MKIGFVIPSRLKSTRLPRKNLLRLGNQTALEWAIDRAQLVPGIDEVVVATTPLSSDSDITKICQKKGIRYFLGDPVDVLKRLRDTANFFDFDYIINITPDNTLFSMYLIELMLKELKSNHDIDYCYFKNAMLGTGIYALKKEALQLVCEFKNVLDTEIWGPLFVEKYYNVRGLELPDFLKSNYRLTMDTVDDYKLMQIIYKNLNISKENMVELEEVIRYLDDNEEIAKINSKVIQTTVANEQIEKIEKFYEENKELFNSIKKKYYGEEYYEKH